ncbi:MAG: MarR family transcriptional regulator [Nitrososphaerota archaeon]|nr:MarR family transcriptional regulator [Nitrososphaerota archaeon]
MFESIISLIYLAAFTVTVIVMFHYFKILRKGASEYLRAKEMLNEIILSFNNDLQKIERRVESLEKYGHEKLELDNIRSRIESLSFAIDEFIKMKVSWEDKFETIKKEIDSLNEKYNELINKVQTIKSRSIIEEGSMRERENIPIIIGRESVLSKLTPTEIKILELLAKKGEQSAPQIKNEIKLTREHTARLMKKLYTKGFIERKTNKIPYTYVLKKEMEDFLKTQNNQR